MARTMKARRTSRCPACRGMIRPGDTITRAPGARRWTCCEGNVVDTSTYRGMCEDAPCCGCCGTNIYGEYQGRF